MKTIIAAAVATAAALVLAAPAAEAKPARSIVSCAAAGETDISMKAVYVLRTDKRIKRKFEAEFEAAPKLGYRIGQVMTVRVGSILAGKVRLTKAVNGDIVGNLELETELSPGSKPFPKDFPTVLKGQSVSIGFGSRIALACTLK